MKKGIFSGSGKCSSALSSLLFTLLACLIALVLSSSAVFALELFIESDSEFARGGFLVEDMYFISSDDIFYYDELQIALRDSGSVSDTDTFVLFDKSDREIMERPLILSDRAVMFFEGDPARIGSFGIFRDGEIYYGDDIDFCNGNGVCEPCYDFPCAVSESFLTCSDCHSGSADDYCDLERDGVCDVDCMDLDGDCPRCTACMFADMKGKSCTEIGGRECDLVLDSSLECVGGKTVALDDFVDCCVGGVCRGVGEYVESMIELQNQPSMTVTSSGLLASSLQDEGLVDYCIDSLKGTFCEDDEECAGDMVEYYPGSFCCVGRCKELPEDKAYFSEEFMGEVAAETSAQPSQDDIASLYDFSEMEKQMDEELAEDNPEETFQELAEGEFPHEIIEEMSDDAPPIFSEDTFENVKYSLSSSAEKTLDSISFLHVVGIILVILVIIGILVALFRRKDSTQMVREEKEAGAVSVNSVKTESATVGEVSSVDLQSEIDAILSQGNDYKQAESVLIRKGFDRSVVDSEIKKNYQKRLALQKLAHKDLQQNAGERPGGK